MKKIQRLIHYVTNEGPACVHSVCLEFGWPKWMADQLIEDALKEGSIRLVRLGGVTQYTAPIVVKAKRPVEIPAAPASVFSLAESLRQGFIESGQLRG